MATSCLPLHPTIIFYVRDAFAYIPDYGVKPMADSAVAVALVLDGCWFRRLAVIVGPALYLYIERNRFRRRRRRRRRSGGRPCGVAVTRRVVSRGICAFL